MYTPTVPAATPGRSRASRDTGDIRRRGNTVPDLYGRAVGGKGARSTLAVAGMVLRTLAGVDGAPRTAMARIANRDAFRREGPARHRHPFQGPPLSGGDATRRCTGGECPVHAYRPHASADARPAVRCSARPLPSRVGCRGGPAASGTAPAGQPPRAGGGGRHTLSPYGGDPEMPAADSAVGPALSGWSHAPPDAVPVQRRGWPAGHGIHAGSEGAQPMFMVAGVPFGSRDPAIRAPRRGGPARILP